MAATVKPALLWRKELDNRPGTLAESLLPFAEARVDLKIVMGYVFPGQEERAALEVFPVSGKKAEQAAQKAGLSPAYEIPCLTVESDNAPGLGHKMTAALSASGINLGFFVVQVIGRKFTAVIGFESPADAKKAEIILKFALKTGAKPRKPASKRKVAAQKKASTKSATKGKKAKVGKTALKAAAKKPLSKKTAGKRVAAKKKTATGKSGGSKSSAKKVKKK